MDLPRCAICSRAAVGESEEFSCPAPLPPKQASRQGQQQCHGQPAPLMPLGVLGGLLAAAVSTPALPVTVSAATGLSATAFPSVQQQLLGEVGLARFAFTQLLSPQTVRTTTQFQSIVQVFQMAQTDKGPAKGRFLIYFRLVSRS